MSDFDPVFQDDNGLWNFWDENAQAYFYGPYDTEEEAREAQSKYARLYGEGNPA